MSAIIFPHFNLSIPLSFKSTSLKLNSKQLSFSTRIPTKQVCFSLPEPKPGAIAKFRDPEPPREDADDEWGSSGVEKDGFGNVSSGPGSVDDVAAESGILKDLKRAFVDTVYGSEFGYRASTESQSKALELVDQLEDANPTPAPTQRPDLLDGNWLLLYTASSELLPLLATGSLPLVKIEKISQSINFSSLTIENATTISSPVASLSFSASAAFEVQTPSRIEVLFKEWTFKSPEIMSHIKLSKNFDIFGQSINLSFLKQSYYSLQNVVARIARSIFGQPRIPVPDNQQPPI